MTAKDPRDVVVICLFQPDEGRPFGMMSEPRDRSGVGGGRADHRQSVILPLQPELLERVEHHWIPLPRFYRADDAERGCRGCFRRNGHETVRSQGSHDGIAERSSGNAGLEDVANRARNEGDILGARDRGVVAQEWISRSTSRRKKSGCVSGRAS